MLGSFGANWGQGCSWAIKVETSGARLEKRFQFGWHLLREESVLCSVPPNRWLHTRPLRCCVPVCCGMLRWATVPYMGWCRRDISIPHCELHSTVIMILSCSFCLMVQFNIIRVEVWVEQLGPSWNKPHQRWRFLRGATVFSDLGLLENSLPPTPLVNNNLLH